MSAARLPMALRLGQIARALPDFPGRDTVLLVLGRRSRGVDAVIQGTYAGGIRFEGNLARDGNVLDFFLLRHARPALAPVLDAALATGGVFADVGANLGLYALYAARRVGPTGAVHAFEPVPGTYERLLRNIALNGFDQVHAVRTAVGTEPGVVRLFIPSDASGTTSRYHEADRAAVDAPVTTLDALFADGRPPDLVKVDVEGMELEVLRGASRLLRSPSAPLLVVETEPIHLSASRTTFQDVAGLLTGHGLRLFSLTPKGLREVPSGADRPGSLNTLAARPETPAHARVLEALRHVRFEANQNA